MVLIIPKVYLIVPLKPKDNQDKSFKPFIYQIALDEGLSPSSMISDEPIEFEYTDPLGRKQIWKPQNCGGESSKR